jgi:G:T-mismatch repair DNA endonuclease (very short patch repair protein)
MIRESKVFTRAFGKTGWRVVRVWEHDLATKHWPNLAARMQRALTLAGFRA